MSPDLPWLNPASRFPDTRASVLERVRSAEPEVRQAAFGQLVTGYWKPVYKYLRLKWHLDGDDAADLTQGFLARAFEKAFFDAYAPDKARFRTFLRVCLDRFVMNEQQAAGALRRGGGAHAVNLDFALAEAETAHHASGAGEDPDRLFHQEMVRDLVSRSLAEVRETCALEGRTAAFRAFERYDVDPPEGVTYASVANELGVPVTQVTNYLAAVRRLFRERVIANLREISGSDDEFRTDARDLFGIEP